MSNDERQWCYLEKAATFPEGPFESRDAALATANANLGPGAEVQIGRVNEVCVADWAMPDLYNLCEEMDQALNDDVAAFEDEVFTVRKGVAPERAREIARQVGELLAELIEVQCGAWWGGDYGPLETLAGE